MSEYYLERLPNKPVYPSGDPWHSNGEYGITFREYLIGQLCANSRVVDVSYVMGVDPKNTIKQNAIDVINQADAIIELLIKEEGINK